MLPGTCILTHMYTHAHVQTPRIHTQTYTHTHARTHARARTHTHTPTICPLSPVTQTPNSYTKNVSHPRLNRSRQNSVCSRPINTISSVQLNSQNSLQNHSNMEASPLYRPSIVRQQCQDSNSMWDNWLAGKVNGNSSEKLAVRRINQRKWWIILDVAGVVTSKL